MSAIDDQPTNLIPVSQIRCHSGIHVKWHGYHQCHTGLEVTTTIYNGVMGYMYEVRVYWGIGLGLLGYWVIGLLGYWVIGG